MTATITFDERDALELVKAGLIQRGYDAAVVFKVVPQYDARTDCVSRYAVQVEAKVELPNTTTPDAKG